MSDSVTSPPMDDNNEFRELMLRVRKGSAEAIVLLIRKYQPEVLDAIRRVFDPKLRSKFDSTEFAQSVWLSFFRAPKRSARLSTSRQFVAYVVKMARNKVFMEERHRGTLKRDVSREVPLNEDCEELVARDPQPVDTAIALERLEKILKDLSPRDRQIVELRLQGKSYAEIGAKLKIDPNTAHRFINRLGKKILT